MCMIDSQLSRSKIFGQHHVDIGEILKAQSMHDLQFK